MHQRHGLSVITEFIMILLSVWLFWPAVAVSASTKPRPAEELLNIYERTLPRLETNSFGIPLLVESSERDDMVHVDVYGIFFHPFGTVSDVLKVPSNWCEIVFLHQNVKACTYGKLADRWLLNLYIGRKSEQVQEDMEPVITQFSTLQHQDYLNVVLGANKGPYGTRDHRMRLEAMPLKGGKTFVHVSYTYSDSTTLRMTSKVYFATLGRSKVGFTVIGTDSSGKPVYIGGPRGALERSAVRYYFAIQSFMNTLRYPEENRFSMRTSEWHDLTSRYRKQLFEMEKQDYMEMKVREHATQTKLQRRMGIGNL